MDQFLLYIGASLFVLLIALYIAKSVFEIQRILKYQSDQNKILTLIAKKIGVEDSDIEEIIPKISEFKLTPKSKEVDDF